MTPQTLTGGAAPTVCRLHHKRLRADVSTGALNEAVADLKFPAILGGNAAVADAGRFSYWVARPREIFVFRSGQDDPFVRLERALGKYRLWESSPPDVPRGVFVGGWVGHFSYELGRYIEQLPQTTVDDLRLPLIRLCFYDRVICYDHRARRFSLFALEMPGDKVSGQDKLAELEVFLRRLHRRDLPKPACRSMEEIDFGSLGCNMTKAYYLDAVARIKRYIYDGEVYQINFSQRFECEYGGRPVDLFHWQNTYNASGYAAYIDAGDYQVVSASPEVFITVADGYIKTKPIKGTRPRISGSGEAEQLNARNYAELLHSEKEKAELNMIVDLERNDLARICIPGTRKVTQPRTIEAYPTVFHAVATVGGKLKAEIGFCDILRAMFPGGSITGAPKIRSMEIIDETEPTARGIYTGSIGFVGVDGSVCLNIAIRTVIIANKTAFVQTGGGIVADSDPQAEWHETITKARALVAGIKAVG